jgi:adenosylcobinamide-GDP ribazoletransferase
MNEPPEAAPHAETGNQTAHQTVRGGVWEQIRLAASFLTIIPLGGERPAAAADVAASLGWFPMVGFALGAILALEDAFLTAFLGGTIGAILVILSLTVLTGAVHLDGLADAADALGAGRNRERALEILRDSRIGSFGAAAIFFALALEAAAIAHDTGAARFTAIFAAVGISRWAMVAASTLDYLRPDGAGAALLDTTARRSNLAIASLTVAGAILPIANGRTIGAVIVAIAIVAALRAFYRRWLGGVTGDLIGACGVIVEAAVLIAMMR